MNSGKTTKYLKYAIGEIILVVIGILIALSINNWNEERKSSNAEAQALVELLAEFKKNQKDLIRIHGRKSMVENSIRSYLKYINNDSIANSEKNFIIEDLAENTWSTQYTVLNSLISTGAINNIKNDSLKNFLTTWNDYVDEYLEQQIYYQNTIIIPYQDFINGKMPIRYRKADSTYARFGNDYFESEDELKAYASKIVHNIEYQNLLKRCLEKLYIQVFVMQPLLNNYPKIVTLLEEEINNNK